MSAKLKAQWKYDIASWKIDSPFERILGKLADRSRIFRKVYVQFYKFHDPEYYYKGLSMITDILSRNYIVGGGGVLLI